LLAAGFLVGPVFGQLDPQATFGPLLSPLVSIAVAIVLFEGGLSLNFAEIRETSPTVRRLILFGAPATWGLGFLAAHYLAGFTAPTAAIIAGIMVVTGPTVIMPLLRQVRLPRRPASLLRWEAIVADPIGALFAVIAYEGAVALSEGHALTETALRLGGAVLIGALIAFVLARVIAIVFIRGMAPEFLKAPLLLVAVLVGFVSTNFILDEAGLLTVTIMGIVLANTRIASLEELRRFKETITILLVSGLFIVLTASTTLDDLARIGVRDVLFLAALLFVIRPAVVFSVTLGSQLTWRERLMCAWIAPRGVVAVAVSGLFATSLAEHGFADADRIVPLAFLVVVATVILHGFSIRPLSLALGLTVKEPPGILIVGASPWASALARKLKDIGMPALIADTNWNRLFEARRDGVPVYYGEILSEAAEHRLDLSQYGALIAATDNDAYNALVCTDLGPEIGRSNVFQLGRTRTQASANGDVERAERHQLHFTVGGRTLFREGLEYVQLLKLHGQGWEFTRTRLSEEFTYDDFLASRAPETKVLFLLKADQRLAFSTTADRVKAGPGDTVISYGPPRENKSEEKAPSAKSPA
jgi:NhaP-type Na+/H+ or K+/H+ antiporter